MYGVGKNSILRIFGIVSLRNRGLRLLKNGIIYNLKVLFLILFDEIIKNQKKLPIKKAKFTTIPI